MCLKFPNKINLEKDLTVYKIFAVKSDSNVLCSPFYRNYVWKKNKVYSTNTNEPIITSVCYSLEDAVNYTIIEGNAFHSYMKLQDALNVKNLLNKNYTLTKDAFLIVCKCIIPKDSNFVYRGISSYVVSYASEKLKIIETVEL